MVNFLVAWLGLFSAYVTDTQKNLMNVYDTNTIVSLPSVCR